MSSQIEDRIRKLEAQVRVLEAIAIAVVLNETASGSGGDGRILASIRRFADTCGTPLDEAFARTFIGECVAFRA